LLGIRIIRFNYKIKNKMPVPQWLEWAREIQALAQSGSHYAENKYQLQRYQRLMEIAAEIVDKYSELESSELLLAFNTPEGYATPKVDVRGAVFKYNQLLLVREKADGGWTLPGGWADVGETPAQAAVREVWEETGFRVKAKKVIGIYDANRVGKLELFHAYKIIFLCELISGSPTVSDETTEVAFFSRKELPVNLSGERTKPRHIKDVFDNLDNPHTPTLFD
jgi:ADP-ribose pyrophosphatase YjhB (NUDIX family)